ncbi:MAG: hypothetical protein K6D96_11425 [Acetatifactor sp.]|nr:hypothetical protein [Acetatifactor sp.]
MAAFLLILCGLFVTGFKSGAESFSADYGKFVYSKDYRTLTGYVYTSYPENITLSVEYAAKSPDNFREAADVLYVGNIAGQKVYRAGFTQTLTEAPIGVSVNDFGQDNGFNIRLDGNYLIFESDRTLSLDAMTDPDPENTEGNTQNPDGNSGSGIGIGNSGNNGNHYKNTKDSSGNNGNHYGNDKSGKEKADKAEKATSKFKAKTVKIKASSKSAKSDENNNSEEGKEDGSLSSDENLQLDETELVSNDENTTETVEKTSEETGEISVKEEMSPLSENGTNAGNGLNTGVLAIVIIFALAAVAGGIFTIKKIGR